MIDYQRLYHCGMLVADLDAAMAELGPVLGCTWASVQHVAAMPLWTPAGKMETPLTFVYSCEGPQHVELLAGGPGSPWDPAAGAGLHHLGIWVDDVATEVDICLAQGWRVTAAAASPDEGYGPFVYVVPPSGPIIELVSSRLQARFERWWAGATLGTERV